MISAFHLLRLPSCFKSGSRCMTHKTVRLAPARLLPSQAPPTHLPHTRAYPGCRTHCPCADKTGTLTLNQLSLDKNDIEVGRRGRSRAALRRPARLCSSEAV